MFSTLRGTSPRLLPKSLENASREETSRSRQVVLNAQRHLCPVEGWGSLILQWTGWWNGAQQD